MAGFVLGDEARTQIQELIRRENAKLRNPDEGHRRQTPINPVKVIQGFLLADLSAASNAVSDPGVSELAIYYRDPSTGFLAYSGRTVNVTNRDTYWGIPSGRYLAAIWVEGEWRPLATEWRIGGVAYTDSSGITAISSNTPGSGTVTLKRLSGSTLVDVVDLADDPVQITLYNMADAVAGETYVQYKIDLFGTPWVDVEAC